MDGAKANVYNSITRPFAVQMGKQYGLAMKKLVDKGEETTYIKPPFPKQEEDVEEAVAIWKTNVKRVQDRMQEYNDKKEKVFSSVLQKCDETVIARLDHMKEYDVWGANG